MSFQWFGEEAKLKLLAARAGALKIGAEYLLEESNRVVPIEEGTLGRSGAVDVDPVAGLATISYDTPYARRQHEDLTFRHDPGRKAKYLEGTMKERGHIAFGIMGEHIRQVMT